MPADAGVDVISGACPPAPKPSPTPKPKPKKLSLLVKPGTCTYFLLQIRGTRLPPSERKRVSEDLKGQVKTYLRERDSSGEKAKTGQSKKR